MSRIPAIEPKLDCIAAASITDPELARVRWLQFADDRAWSLFTAWGGSGLYVPLRQPNASTREIQLRVPPGFQYVDIKALVSGDGFLTITSTTTGVVRTAGWAKLPGGNTLPAADFAASLSGVPGGTSGPLQVRSGVAYTWSTDKVTIVSATADGKGKTYTGMCYGLLITPLYVDAL